MREYRIGRLKGRFVVTWIEPDGKRRRYRLDALTRKAAETEAIDRIAKESIPKTGATVADLWAQYQEYLGDRPAGVTMGYTGKAVLPHFGHMRGPWCKYAELVRYDFFPDRRLALIAETISIEDEKPDFNEHVRLTSREWPVYLHWYRDKTGGKFVSERSAWFSLTGGYSIGAQRDEPEWWVPGFCNSPYDEWRT